MYRLIIVIIAVLFVVGCTSSNDNSIEMQFDPELVGDAVTFDNVRMQAPAEWASMSDSIKTSLFGTTDIAVFATADNKAMMHAAPAVGDAETLAALLKESLEAAAPGQVRYDVFTSNEITFYQYIIQQEAITYKLLAADADSARCELTYTLDPEVFPLEIKKVESSIASILFQ